LLLLRRRVAQLFTLKMKEKVPNKKNTRRFYEKVKNTTISTYPAYC
jgi:hypothetical protein